MTTNIHQLIAALCPDVYCTPQSRRAVRQAWRTDAEKSWQRRLLAAAKVALPVAPNTVPREVLEAMNPLDLPGFRSPREQHMLGRDALSESIEAFYFLLLDAIERQEGWRVFKLADDFQAAPLSSLGADTLRTQKLAQDQVVRGLAAIQELTRAILDAVEDIEALQQSMESALALDPHTVSRQQQRLALEKAQLRAKLSSLQLQIRWLRPWQRAARLFSSSERGASPNLVDAFNTACVEVLWLAAGPDIVEGNEAAQDLPAALYKPGHRSFCPVLVVELSFRTRPDRTPSRTVVHHGRVEVTITSYGLKDEEIDRLRRFHDDDESAEDMGLAGELDMKAMHALTARAEALLREPEGKPTAQCAEDVNPFVALYEFFRSRFSSQAARSQVKMENSSLGVRADSGWEKVARSLAILRGRDACAALIAEAKNFLAMGTGASV